MLNTIIQVKNVSKVFKIPHEKRDTLKEMFVGLFKKRKYETFYALRDINLEINQGDFFGIIGPNGSGKSTLLKIISGILRPDRGKVVVNGSIAPFLELGVGFQPDLSARDNVYLYGAILGLTRQQINRKFKEIIDFAELGRFVDQKVKNFSSGMQVRLAFSTAIQAEADILILDEVLAVGDFSFQEKCRNFFREFKKQGKTAIYVSHQLKTITDFCDRAVLLSNGMVQMSGNSVEVVNKYIRDQVAGKNSNE